MHKIIDNFLVNQHSNNGNGGSGRKISSITDYTSTNASTSQQQLMINEQLFQKMLSICIDHFKSQQSSTIGSPSITKNMIDPNEIDQFIQSYYSTNSNNNNFNTFLNSVRSRSSPNHFIFKVYLNKFLFLYHIIRLFKSLLLMIVDHV